MSALLNPQRSSEAESERSFRGANDDLAQIGPKAAQNPSTFAASCGIRGRPTGIEPVTPGATVRAGPPSMTASAGQDLR